MTVKKYISYITIIRDYHIISKENCIDRVKKGNPSVREKRAFNEKVFSRFRIGITQANIIQGITKIVSFFVRFKGG